MSRFEKIFGPVLVLALFIVCVTGAWASSSRFDLMVQSYPDSTSDLWQRHPAEVNQLYKRVERHYSLQELKTILSKKAGVELDEFHMARIESIASPHSVRIQRQEHIDWVPKLVNEETLKKGTVFFEEHKRTFQQTYERTGVKPQDIIAVLNWESRLGAHKGQYDVVKIFVGQIFMIDEVERKIYAGGAYDEQGAMPRQEALMRIHKIKNRAIGNLGELLIQAKLRNFDPYLVKGSWAGAIGIPQFMPASMHYAADGNGDGAIDLNTFEDSIMSVGNFLSKSGYHSKGPEYALKRYNSEEQYVRGVALYSREVEKLGVRPPSEWVYRSKS